jgi:hypothetical protein
MSDALIVSAITSFPFALLSGKALADLLVEFSLGEFLLLGRLLGLILSYFRRVLCILRGGRRLGCWRGFNFR